jgi:hypothetical protein
MNWDLVIADAERGVQTDFSMRLDNVSTWYQYGIGGYIHQGGFNAAGMFTGLWQQINYFMLGMADQSGNYQRWINAPLADRHPNLGQNAADPFVIVTPDNRFPRGNTLAEQRANQGGRYYYAATTTGMHGQPGRGFWRWSWYLNSRQLDWMRDAGANPDYRWIRKAEMDLLRAEGHFRKGQLAQAATLINVSRVASGLSATDAGGTNTSCVPKLPNGSCGNLLEMLKWEKRNETLGAGLYGVPWYFDGRGWGDLYRGTQLEFPMPCREAQVLLLECYTFGGVGGTRASPGSSYQYPGE